MKNIVDGTVDENPSEAQTRADASTQAAEAAMKGMQAKYGTGDGTTMPTDSTTVNSMSELMGKKKKTGALSTQLGLGS